MVSFQQADAAEIQCALTEYLKARTIENRNALFLVLWPDLRQFAMFLHYRNQASNGILTSESVSDAAIVALRALDAFDASFQVPVKKFVRRCIWRNVVNVARKGFCKDRICKNHQTGFIPATPNRFRDYYAEEKLHRALATLTEKQRKAVVETVMYDRTCVEVAEEMGVTKQAVSLLVGKAMGHLRAAMGREDSWYN